MDTEGAEIGRGELADLETCAAQPPDIVIERVDADMIFLAEALSLLLRVVDCGVFEGMGDGGRIGHLQDGHSAGCEHAEDLFYSFQIVGDMFEDVIGDDDVGCGVCKGKTGRIGVGDIGVNVAVEARGDVDGSNGGGGFF